MTLRRRLLIVAYHYPPRETVGGRRPAQLRKYLPLHGWEATILTARVASDGNPQPGIVATKYVDILGSLKARIGFDGTSTHERLGVEIPRANETRQSLRQRGISFAYQLCTFPDREVGWAPYALRALRELLQRERFDAVLTTSPPYVSGVVAALAGCNVPWVVDLRDLWTQTDFIVREPSLRWLERRIERWMLGRAAAITTISEPAQERLSKEFPSIPVTTIYNAFDPDDWIDVPFGRNDRCTMLFAGALYRGRMRPEPLFRAVRRLLDRGALVGGDLSIDIYSDQTAMIARSAQAEGVNGIVRALDYVPRETILRLERRADRLLFFVPDGTGADTVVGGKTLEYFGARKRVLAIGGGERSAIDDVLRQAAAGTRVTTLDDIEAEVLRAVSEFKEDRTQTLSADAVATFDAPHLAGHFAQLLDRVIATRRSKAR